MRGARPNDPQQIGRLSGDKIFEQAGFAAGLERRDDLAVGSAQDIDLDGAGQKSPHDAPVGRFVRPEHSKRISVRAEGKRSRRLRFEPP